MPYKVVRDFEAKVAEFSGSKYAVAVESGTAAIFLSLGYRKFELGDLGEVEIPKRTYPSVPCSIIHWGGRVRFTDAYWQVFYELKPLSIVDGALGFFRRQYRGGLHCLSFHLKKVLPIGRGGMILTDDEDAYKWLKKARFDGRDECALGEDNFTMLGFNMYMSPEQAARGLQLFSAMPDKHGNCLVSDDQGYPDLSLYPVYRD